MDELKLNHHYVFEIHHRCIEHYPKFVQTYMKSIVGRFEGCCGKSYIFNHTLPNAHHLILGALSNVAQNNYVNYKENPFDLTSHIYKDRLKIVKDITLVVRMAVDKFKHLLVLKRERRDRNTFVVWMLTEKGFNRDICEEILRRT